MSNSRVAVLPWTEAKPPSEAAIRKLLDAEGLRPYAWGNEPGDIYAAHTHPYHKVIYVVEGSITFGLPDEGRSLRLKPGDRLELPAGVVHTAAVGMEGVICLEAHHYYA